MAGSMASPTRSAPSRGCVLRCRSTHPTASPSQQLFVLLVPEHATDQHLQLLSELAQMFSERAFRDRLTQAPDAATVAGVFRDWNSAA